MEITGTIHKVFDTQQVSKKFKRREFVIEFAESPLYPQFIKFEAIQDKCRDLDPYSPGEQVRVQFNLRGREWTNPEGEKKYFTNLEAWRIDRVAETDTTKSQGGGFRR